MNLLIYITRQSDLSSLTLPDSSDFLSEKNSASDEADARDSSPHLSPGDIEKGALQQPVATMTSSGNEIRPGRPDIKSLIEHIVTSSCSREDRIIIGACGPYSLMHTTRQAVNNRALTNEWSITLYTEVSE